MADEGVHLRRLANDRHFGGNIMIIQKFRHPGGPKTADFLIKGKSEVNRHTQLVTRRDKIRNHGQRDGNKPFHINSAAPIEPSLIPPENEGVALPPLS